MSNPLLDDKFFGHQRAAHAGIDTQIPAAWDNAEAGQWPPPDVTAERTMTMGGVAAASGVLLFLVLLGGLVGWSQVDEVTGVDALGRVVTQVNFPTGLVIGSALVGFVLALVCSFRPKLARVLSPIYAFVEGVFLGAISHAYDVQWNGVALQAVLATVGVFAVMALLYGTRTLRATPRLVKGVVAATFGVMAVYVVGMIGSLFGADLRFWDSASPLGILISVVVVGIAAFNLILDFDFIERGVQNRLPAHMEWFAAFGLVVTIVWLYLELLRLLAKLQRN